MTNIRAFIEVDLSRIQSPEIEEDWTTTKSYARPEVEKWVRQLGQIQALARDRGCSYDDFVRMRSSQDPDVRALAHVHHKFYDHAEQGAATNSASIRLSWSDNRYVIDNGHHRIHLAKQLGLSTIPAEVVAPEEHMDQLRSDGYRTSLLPPVDRQESTFPATRSNPEASTESMLTANSEGPLWERNSVVNRARKERLDR